MTVYLTPQMGVGRHLRLDTIDRRLASWPLVPVLDLLAQMSFRADSTHGQSAQLELVDHVLPPSSAVQARFLLSRDGRVAVLSSQALAVLALRALVACPITGQTPSLDRLAKDLGELGLAVAGHLDRDIDRDQLLLELVRLELWYRVHDLDSWYETSHRLFLETMDTLGDDPDWIDTRTIIEDLAEMSLERFLAITSALGLYSTQTVGGHVHPKYFDETSSVTAEEVDRLTSVWTTGVNEARNAASLDLLDERGWSFGAFYDRPLIAIDEHRRLVVRPWFLGLKGTPLGLYGLVERVLRDSSGDTFRWSRLFGRAVEKLGRTLVLDNISNYEVLEDETSIRRRWGPGKACDLVILGDRWLAIDFVFRRISRPTATTGGVGDLAKDLGAGVVDKLIQIDATISRAIDHEGVPPNGIYPLVVIGAPFPNNGLAVNEIDRLLEIRKPQSIGLADGIKEPMYMDIGEFSVLCELSGDHRLHPATLVDRWINSSMRLTSFRNWAVTLGPGQPSSSGRRRYWDHAQRELFGH